MIVATTYLQEATRRMTGNLRQFYPHVPVMTAVQYLAQRDELRRMGAKHEPLQGCGSFKCHTHGPRPAIVR